MERHKNGKMEGGGVMDYCVRDGKLFFCVGESGVEGVKASLLTTIVKAQFRTAATFESQPDKIMSAINNALAQKENKGIDIRLFIGVLDIYNGKLYFCNASHAGSTVGKQRVAPPACRAECSHRRRTQLCL